MVRWLISMLFLGFMGASGVASSNPFLAELVSSLEKRGVLMDPDGFERAVEQTGANPESQPPGSLN